MDNLRLRIMYDTDAQNPRTDYDPYGTMACWHRRYELGEVQPDCTPEEYIADLPEGTVILPLYLYDHGGITMSTSNAWPFDCPWDAGQVGIIYCTPEQMKEYGVSDKDLVRQSLVAAVEEYDHYLTGAVYGYVVERAVTCGECGHTEWEHVDSCWGFFGHDMRENGLADALPPEALPLLDDCEPEAA